MLIPTGWECPKCHAIMAPNSMICFYCRPIRVEIVTEPEIKNQCDNILLRKINFLDLMPRIYNCLQRENFIFIGDILCNPHLRRTPTDPFGYLLRIPNFGKVAFKDIKNELIKRSIFEFYHYPEYLSRRFELTGEKYEFPDLQFR